MKEEYLKMMFNGYYDASEITEELEEAKESLCDEPRDCNILIRCVRAESEQAFKAGFEMALALLK